MLPLSEEGRKETVVVPPEKQSAIISSSCALNIPKWKQRNGKERQTKKLYAVIMLPRDMFQMRQR